MKKPKYIFKIMLMLCISSIFLVGCGNKMYDKAIEQGKLAVANKEYDKAKASFELALEEKEDDGAKEMLMQVENMIAGIKAKENASVEEALEFFQKVVNNKDVLASISEEAEEYKLELEEIKNKMNTYEDKIIEVENMLEEKKYEESKEILGQLIAETNENQNFDKQNKKAEDLLVKVNSAVGEAERLKQEEEGAEKQRLAEEKKKKEAAGKKTPLDNAVEVAKKSLGTDELTHYDVYHEGELYYYFTTTDYPRVSTIIGLNGKVYDAYTFNREGILEEF